jgi:hypothetical protein
VRQGRLHSSIAKVVAISCAILGAPVAALSADFGPAYAIFAQIFSTEQSRLNIPYSTTATTTAAKWQAEAASTNACQIKLW